MDPNSWEVLFTELAIPVTPQGGCVCYTSRSGLLIFSDFSDSGQENMIKVTFWESLRITCMLCKTMRWDTTVIRRNFLML